MLTIAQTLNIARSVNLPPCVLTAKLDTHYTTISATPVRLINVRNALNMIIVLCAIIMALSNINPITMEIVALYAMLKIV